MFHFPFPAILSLFSPPVTYCKYASFMLLVLMSFTFTPRTRFYFKTRKYLCMCFNLDLKIVLFFSTGLFPAIKLSTHYSQRVAMFSALTPPLGILSPLPISGCHLSVHPLWNLALRVPQEFTTHISTVGSNKFPPPPKCLINSCFLNVYFTSNPRGNRKDIKIKLSTTFLPQPWCSFGSPRCHSASLLWALLSTLDVSCCCPSAHRHNWDSSSFSSPPASSEGSWLSLHSKLRTVWVVLLSWQLWCWERYRL